jgi:hypothetical protein
MELLQREDKDELFRRCINRCDQAFTEIYEYEQAKKSSFWHFDERYYELDIVILYERYCYAMAIIVDKFQGECGLLSWPLICSEKKSDFRDVSQQLHRRGV